jgi:hypothetical protein
MMNSYLEPSLLLLLLLIWPLGRRDSDLGNLLKTGHLQEVCLTFDFFPFV